tara:strand:+ start:2522 stop:4411 length:1890 start_codon:yes stop_codon:yes gene_type:complete
MKSRVISIATFLLAMMVIGEAQSITGSYQLHSVRVVYRNHVRAADHADDADIDGVYSTWVIPYGGTYIAMDADEDGVADLKVPAAGGGLGATVTVESFPEARDPFWLINYIGVDLTVALDQENGTAIIPGDPTKQSTYPTTATENCVTQLTVAAVSDNQTNTYSEPIVLQNGNVVWGFGIQESTVFDWFKPINPKVHYPKKKGDNHPPFPGAPDSSWGMIVGRDATENADGTMRFKRADIRWHALDGPYETGGSDSGIDEDGAVNRQLGVAVTADNVTIPGMAAWGAEKTGSVVNIGDYPMIGGRGFDNDKLSFTPGQQLLTHTSVGGTWDGVGYIFDARGGDGIPFSGDEPFQFTGYYMTANFAGAVGAFGTALQTALATDPTDPKAALTAAALAVAEKFGLTGTTAAAVAAGVADLLYADYGAAVQAMVAAGMDPVQAALKAITDVGTAGVVKAVGALAGAGVSVNDGTHDFDATNPTAGGRLLFQVDAATAGGLCVPVFQTRDVFAHFTNVEDWVAPTGPIKPLTIISDETSVPFQYALHNNYPNPFNPVTTISFDLPEEIHTEVEVYNMMGQKVRTLHSGSMTAGRHHILFDGVDDQYRPLSSGVYFYRIVAGDFFGTKKMMLIK